MPYKSQNLLENCKEKKLSFKVKSAFSIFLHFWVQLLSEFGAIIFYIAANIFLLDPNLPENSPETLRSGRVILRPVLEALLLTPWCEVHYRQFFDWLCILLCIQTWVNCFGSLFQKHTGEVAHHMSVYSYFLVPIENEPMFQKNR